jgi:glucosyl-3-phosphoglycerate synthase
VVLPDLDPARAWLARRTYPRARHDVTALAAAKAGRRTSVLLPARNEAETLGPILADLHRVVDAGLVDEVLVVDSRSSDGTAQVAEAAGVRVVPVADGPDLGKGGAMRAGLAAMTGDLGVFLDADVEGGAAGFATALLAPLLADPTLVLVKGFYRRPGSGGRVTELVARPLLSRQEPRLSGLVQPLSGEAGFRRDALRRLPLVSGYGVETGMLLSVLRAHGLDALGQVDLGERRHRSQDLVALGAMALQVQAALDLVTGGADVVEDDHVTFAGQPPALVAHRVVTRLLPPIEA